ncbi:hypothetical protein [Thermus sediminis]|uniref:hypothetical protein n=1 Tax=Thermus sediminis TaxID=1761908 RepID=UPI0018E4FF44|nr:hypothetical protein [Thermus sediminis]
MVDGKTLRGSGKGDSPQVGLVGVLAPHLLDPFAHGQSGATLAQAKVEGREDRALLGFLEPSAA